ncbi:unnamed protein product [Brassica rapa]|uniref:Uncharacterized protein n=2 Tax=Brassica TaxID=3705 RepID=A0A3P5Z6A8_BRACM|nr:unnamed protein product [Brassica napus]CAG7872761.1 unnamed protein product [Brassica rapa]CDY13610.1 BnaA06g33130D [Brassica napus]VDC68600.1 unnamed protein product [Brassica rapa]
MARLHVALLLLLFAAVVVSAVDKPSTITSGAPATAPTNVAKAPGGNDNKDAAATPGEVAGSMGSDSSNANYPPPQPPSGNDATATVGFAYYVAAAMVGSFLFL